MRRPVLAALIGTGLALAAPASPAAAHPLGNFSVNQLAALSLTPDAVTVRAVVDSAEIPTVQEKSTVDTSGDGVADGTERAAHAASTCAALASRFEVAVDGRRLSLAVTSAAFSYSEGTAALPTGRLECTLAAPARLDSPATVTVANTYLADRIGWRELTATGTGVRLLDPSLPAVSRAADLRDYPAELITNPPDVRTATLRTEPGEGDGTAVAAPLPDRSSYPGAGLVAAADARLRDLLTGGDRTVTVGLLAVLLALVLGAAHAVLPGHGKTVMAAYLAGKRGRPRDAVAVGAVVTATHTGGVLAVGLLLTTVVGLAGQVVLGWLGVASGALILVVGAAMLWGPARGGTTHGGHGHPHGEHTHSHAHGGHTHSHGPGRWSIAGIGIAGGLVPSPSALIVLLAAIGLGRTWFGVLLVTSYGIGMAATLTGAGLLLVGLRRRLAARRARLGPWHRAWARVSRAAPATTGSLVLLVGLGVLGRAAATLL
jgi:nickel/cobalt exporter